MSTPWRNGSASDSRSEGCVFKSRRGHLFYSDINNCTAAFVNLIVARNNLAFKKPLKSIKEVLAAVGFEPTPPRRLVP